MYSIRNFLRANPVHHILNFATLNVRIMYIRIAFTIHHLNECVRTKIYQNRKFQVLTIQDSVALEEVKSFASDM